MEKGITPSSTEPSKKDIGKRRKEEAKAAKDQRQSLQSQSES